MTMDPVLSFPSLVRLSQLLSQERQKDPETLINVCIGCKLFLSGVSANSLVSSLMQGSCLYHTLPILQQRGHELSLAVHQVDNEARVHVHTNSSKTPTAIKIMKFAIKLMELENITLSEVIQTQKDRDHMFSLIS